MNQVSEKTHNYPVESPARHVSLFRNGANQAVRIPKEFELPGKKALMLCRSGVRSIAAAKRATELGLEAFNILEGFEGDPDEHAHRGHKGGWRHQNLPWRQG